jgi:hypothetical protein
MDWLIRIECFGLVALLIVLPLRVRIFTLTKPKYNTYCRAHTTIALYSIAHCQFLPNNISFCRPSILSVAEHTFLHDKSSGSFPSRIHLHNNNINNVVSLRAHIYSHTSPLHLHVTYSPPIAIMSMAQMAQFLKPPSGQSPRFYFSYSHHFSPYEFQAIFATETTVGLGYLPGWTWYINARGMFIQVNSEPFIN